MTQVTNRQLYPPKLDPNIRVAAATQELTDRLTLLESTVARNKASSRGTIYGPFVTAQSGTMASGGESFRTTVLGATVRVDPNNCVVFGMLEDGSGAYAALASWRNAGFGGTPGTSGFYWQVDFSNPSNNGSVNCRLKFCIWTP